MSTELATPIVTGAVLVPDATLVAGVLLERRERGLDKYDEVWDGVYVMHALPNDEHQKITNRLCHALTDVIEDAGRGEVRPGINLALDAEHWERDYREPDVVVFLDGSGAVCHGVFWTGPADFAVEIISPSDKAREKLAFYAQAGTRELLFIDRDPWRLELHRHDGAGLPLAEVGELGGGAIASRSLPITLRLVEGDPRPRILVSESGTDRQWTV
ncbi:MAG: Uma2 family endonuclease [Planctomycetota bacterium]